MSNTVGCPLCQENKMHLVELKSAPNGRENKSYLWVCDTCPGILLEWWDHTDTDAFNKYIDGHEGIIKDWSEINDPTV